MKDQRPLLEVVKEKAKELGYTPEQIGEGSELASYTYLAYLMGLYELEDPYKKGETKFDEVLPLIIRDYFELD